MSKHHIRELCRAKVDGLMAEIRVEVVEMIKDDPATKQKRFLDRLEHDNVKRMMDLLLTTKDPIVEMTLLMGINAMSDFMDSTLEQAKGDTLAPA